MHDYRGLQHRGSRAHVARCCFNILAPRDLARNAMVTMTAPPPGPHPLVPQTPQSRPLYPSSPQSNLETWLPCEHSGTYIRGLSRQT